MAEPTNETNLSGAPDNTVIWDERNVLVHPELDAHFREQADIVLNGRPEADAGDTGREVIPPNTPAITQRLDTQTEDIMTNPLPTTDPNTMPTRISSVPSEAQVDINRQVIDEAKAEINAPDINIDAEIRNTGGNPTREDELGNVRGNPLGAEGGANTESAVSETLETEESAEAPRTIPPRNKRSG